MYWLQYPDTLLPDDVNVAADGIEAVAFAEPNSHNYAPVHGRTDAQ